MAASSRFQQLGLSYEGAFCCLCRPGSICWQSLCGKEILCYNTFQIKELMALFLKYFFKITISKKIGFIPTQF